MQNEGKHKAQWPGQSVSKKTMQFKKDVFEELKTVPDILKAFPSLVPALS